MDEDVVHKELDDLYARVLAQGALIEYFVIAELGKLPRKKAKIYADHLSSLLDNPVMPTARNEIEEKIFSETHEPTKKALRDIISRAFTASQKPTVGTH